MENFYRIVTDERLSLQVVNEHLRTVSTGSYMLDEYTAVTSGGCSFGSAALSSSVRHQSIPGI